MLIKIGQDWVDHTTVLAIRPTPASVPYHAESEPEPDPVPARVCVDRTNGDIVIVFCDSFQEASDLAGRIAAQVNEAIAMATGGPR